MFRYCTEILHLSEPEAYFRITAARAARQHPVLLSMLADGRLHLTAIVLLAPHLTADNESELLSRAVHRSKHQIEQLLAELFPQADVPATIRRLPEPRATLASGSSTSGSEAPPAPAIPSTSWTSAPETRPAGPGAAQASPAPGLGAELAPDGVPFDRPIERDHVARRHATDVSLAPIAPGRYRVQFTASEDFRDKLERLRALMSWTVPDGDLAAVLEAVVTEKVERLEARRYGSPKSEKAGAPGRPIPPNADSTSSALVRVRSTRHIAAAVRRAVRIRDEHRCRYVDDEGRRCSERHRLEFHHRQPYGYGGRPTVENVCLLCRTHNSYLARVDYGGDKRGGGGQRGRGA